jgi:PPIC-type PPIASE domain
VQKFIVSLLFIVLVFSSKSQSLTQIKKILDTTNNPIGYVKFILKKKYKIDTVAVLSTSSFLGKADSLAYKGKVGKVYGPFKGENILVKILMKAPNTFYHVSHILLDTTNYRPRYAESLCDSILQKITTNTNTFASLASTYSDDKGSAQKNGDLGWFARGALLPQLDAQLGKRKKGEIFKVWTAAGLHLVKIMDNPKQDVGYALMLRVLMN